MAIGDLIRRGAAFSGELRGIRDQALQGLLGLPSEADLREDREGAAVGLIRSNPGLSAAFAGDAAKTPAAQGIFQGLTSTDPVARNLAGIAGEQISGRTGLLADTAAAAQQARRDRIDRQREGFKFTQDAAAKQQEAQLKAFQIDSAALSLARSGFEFEQLKATAAQPKVTPEQALEFNALKGTLDSVDTMIQIRKDFGTMSPAEMAAHPEAAAALKSFQSFETVSLFKSLLNDQRVSDEDREFYRSIIDRGFFDVMFAGGGIEEAQLQQLADRLARTQQVMLATTPDALELLPNLFQRKRDTFTDIGVPFERVPPPQNAPPSLGSFGSVGGSF